VPNAAPNQELFVSSWDVYRKMVDNDYLSHRGAYATLRTVLLERENAPFSFLDVACGDACMSCGGSPGNNDPAVCGNRHIRRRGISRAYALAGGVATAVVLLGHLL
jgi:hypothetical protein